MSATFSPEVAQYLKDLAEENGIEGAALMAVVDTEGRVVDLEDGIQDGMVNGFVMIRWEGHYFYKLLKGEQRAQAVRLGYAAQKHGVVKNPRSMAGRHALLKEAMEINEEMALRSISMGVGQVMGENFGMCGYASVFEMWDDCHSLEGQARAMLGFIKGARLLDEIQQRKWAAFARAYNGPSYKENAYDVKMAQAYRRFGGEMQTNVGYEADGVLRMGSRNTEAVKRVQQRLLDLGYPVLVDGDYGTTTRRYVLAFQAENNLDVDGEVGPNTWRMLEKASPVISVERQNASAAEIAPRSRIITESRAITVVAGATAATEAITPIAEALGLDDVVAKAEQVKQIAGALKPLIELSQQYSWLLPVAAGLMIVLFARKIIAARVEDHRTGKTV